MTFLSPSRLWLLLACAVLIGGNLVSAFTAASAVPSTRAGEASETVTVSQLRPSACSAVVVTSLVTGSGTFSGTNSNELMLGSAAADNMSASGGNDCLVAGASNDTLNGGQGTDVCLGQGGTDTFTACETQVQ